MDKNEAKELLSFHSTRNEDIDNMKWEKGFLGSLRPFRGELYEENLFEVIECLRALKDEFSGIAIEKDIISDIVAIIHYPRVWLAPEGMLGRGGNLSAGEGTAGTGQFPACNTREGTGNGRTAGTGK